MTPANFSTYFTFGNMTNSSSYPEVVEANRLEALEFIESGIKLSKLLEEIRHFLGIPLIESSGFRGKTLTQAGKFSKTSSHTRFEACDVVPRGMKVKEAFNRIKGHYDKFPELRKVILEQVNGKEWLHIEVKTKAEDILAFYTTEDGKNYIKV